MNLHVLIADDELPARDELRFILASLWPDAHFHEAGNGEEALHLIDNRLIDVAFLDINMPVLDGLQAAAILSEMPQPPLIVFATAYDQHALAAFELAAVDYVVKPFDERRLEKTAVRLQTLLGKPAARTAQQAALQTYLSQTKPQPITKLWAERENENRVLVDYSQIVWLEARDKRVYVTLEEEQLLVRLHLSKMETLLKPHNFIRVHRSFIVNVDFIAEVVPWFSGGYLLQMRDKVRTEIPMSRRYAKNLKSLIDW